MIKTRSAPQEVVRVTAFHDAVMHMHAQKRNLGERAHSCIKTTVCLDGFFSLSPPVTKGCRCEEDWAHSYPCTHMIKDDKDSPSLHYYNHTLSILVSKLSGLLMIACVDSVS